MNPKIKRIDIKAFRGIPDLPVELDGKNLLIRGDNGTGKSSIVDAIEFFFCGRISHLEGVQGLSLQRHAPHVAYEQKDVSICVTFDPGNIELLRTFNKVPACTDVVKDYFNAASSGNFILRRAQILEFIMSQPAERFRAISSILGIDELDNYELEIMRARDRLEAGVSSAGARIKGLYQELSGLLEQEIKSKEETLKALNEQLKALDLPIIESFDALGKHAEIMLGKIKSEEAIRRAGHLEEITSMTKTKIIEPGRLNQLTEINKGVKELSETQNKKERSIAALLDIGSSILSSWELENCPLCEQAINRDELLQRIRKRLELVKSLSARASEIRRLASTSVDELKGISRKIELVITRLKNFSEFKELESALESKLNSIREFIQKVEKAGEAEDIVPMSDLNKLVDEINNMGDSIFKSSSQLFSSEMITDEEKNVLRITNLLGQVSARFKDLDAQGENLKLYQSYFKVAEKVYSIFVRTKKDNVQVVFDAIQNDLQKYYSILHPTDPHGNIQLKLSTGKRASIELKIESFGKKDEDPRAFTSEGHLDSLGLCIFLAFIKTFHQNCSLIVLDDVVTTVDAGHRENICKLLNEELGDKQLVITTHDPVWYEQIRAYNRAYGNEGNFIYRTILDWDVASGPKVRPYKPRWQRIEEKISNGDKTAGNDGRQYLEWALELASEIVESLVPYRHSGKYEIGEMMPQLEKRLADLIKDGEPFKNELLDSIRNLKCMVIYGNITSHNNILAEQLTIEEVKNFCESVRDFHMKFTCPNCSKQIRYFRDLKRLRCSNPKCAKFEVVTN